MAAGCFTQLVLGSVELVFEDATDLIDAVRILDGVRDDIVHVLHDFLYCGVLGLRDLSLFEVVIERLHPIDEVIGQALLCHYVIIYRSTGISAEVRDCSICYGVLEQMIRHLRAVHVLVVEVDSDAQQEISKRTRQVGVVVKGSMGHFGGKLHFDVGVAVGPADLYVRREVLLSSIEWWYGIRLSLFPWSRNIGHFTWDMLSELLNRSLMRKLDQLPTRSFAKSLMLVKGLISTSAPGAFVFATSIAYDDTMIYSSCSDRPAHDDDVLGLVSYFGDEVLVNSECVIIDSVDLGRTLVDAVAGVLHHYHVNLNRFAAYLIEVSQVIGQPVAELDVFTGGMEV